MIDLSIVILSYNTKKLILDCIESVLKERSQIKLEIVVVDNNSSDGSAKAIHNSQLTTRNFKIIQNKKNLGFSRAVNQGIKKTSGKFILLLNSDTRVKKGALSKLLKFAKEKGDAGVVGLKLLESDGKRIQPSCFNFPTIGRAIRQYWFGGEKLLDKFVPAMTVSAEAVEVEAVVGAAFLITPKALRQVGLLDERYFMYFEDIDYCRRVWQAGLKVYYLLTAEVIHIHGASPEPEQVRFRVNGKKKGEETKWNYLETSSKIYHGVVRHYLLNFIIWSGQKWCNLVSCNQKEGY